MSYEGQESEGKRNEDDWGCITLLECSLVQRNMSITPIEIHL